MRRPEGQGLNDLYVRFFRMAERRIAEKTGQGVVCFISNYSWLDGLSFTGMRERYLEEFDAIRIDCLNGDKYKTGKTRLMARPTQVSSPRRKIRSASRSAPPSPRSCARRITRRPRRRLRHFWGQAKREQLGETAGRSRPTGL